MLPVIQRDVSALKNALIAISCLLSGASAVLAQSPSPLSFEVASIRQIEYTEQVRDEVLAWRSAQGMDGSPDSPRQTSACR